MMANHVGRFAAACWIAALLVACGGGDEGDTSGPQIEGGGSLAATVTPVDPPGSVQNLSTTMVEAGIGLIDEGEPEGAGIPLPRPASLYADLSIGIQFPATGAFLDLEVINFSKDILGVPIAGTEEPPPYADRATSNRGTIPVLRAVWYPQGLGVTGAEYLSRFDPSGGTITVTKLSGGEFVATFSVRVQGQANGDWLQIQTTGPMSAVVGVKTAPRAFVAAVVGGTYCYNGFTGNPVDAPCDVLAVGAPVVFDVSESEDVDGEVRTWRIDYADGSPAEAYTFPTALSVPHSFAAPGAYFVKVWVTDNDGLESPLILTPPATTPTIRVVVQ